MPLAPPGGARLLAPSRVAASRGSTRPIESAPRRRRSPEYPARHQGALLPKMGNSTVARVPKAGFKGDIPVPMSAQDSCDTIFSRERYEQRRGEVRLHMSHFFLRYLSDIYEAFGGDLAMAIVLGEISHHNTIRYFSPQKPSNKALRAIQNEPACWTGMQGCNAYSLSCATGIPRETVRRKIAELKRRGWVEEMPKRSLRITKTCADHFGADYSLRFLNGMLRASRIIEALLAEDDQQGNQTTMQSSGVSTPKKIPGATPPHSGPKPKPRKK